MAPGLLIGGTGDAKLSEDAKIIATTGRIELASIAAVIFVIAVAFITIVNCACCKKGKKKGEAQGAPPDTIATIGSSKAQPAASISVDNSSAAVGLTTRRDASKTQPANVPAIEGAIPAPVPVGGAPAVAKTATSSQQAPAATLHAVPAFQDFVTDSKH